MSVNANVAKAVAEEGGITILAGLARSMNRLVAEEAAGGLWNLSVGEEHKVWFGEFCLYRLRLGITLKLYFIVKMIFASGRHCGGWWSKRSSGSYIQVVNWR